MTQDPAPRAPHTPRTRVVISLLFLTLLTTAHSWGGEHAELKKRLGRSISLLDFAAIGRCFDEISRLGDAEAVEIILKALESVPPEEVLTPFMAALERIPIEVSDAVITEYMARKKANVLVISAILTASIRIPGEVAESWVLAGLENENDIVFRNALAALVDRKSKAAIPILFQRLGTFKPADIVNRVGVEAALFRLTAHEFDTVEDWEKWWETVKDNFDPAQAHAETEGKTGVAKRLDDDEPEFFGVKIVSNKVMFVIDCSGSMEFWDEGGKDRVVEYKEERQRINRMKRQLLATIGKLPKGSYFNVISFSHVIEAFSKRGLVPATGSWKRKGGRFVADLEPVGATHTGDALKKAFEDPRIDTIILLSDGAPMRRDGENPNLISEILEDVRNRNKLRKVKIHTFGFEGLGEAPPGGRQPRPPKDPDAFVEFLKQLAKENGGEYTSIE